MASVGLALLTGAALANAYLHRGIEPGDNRPYTEQPTDRGLATNVDLTLLAPDQLDSVAGALEDAGIRFVRQSFAWSAIEPQPGSFVWDRYDPIVNVLGEHGISVVPVLHQAPNWARASQTRGVPDAPPVDLTMYGRFVEQVLRHYGERLQVVQLWDLPNRPDHWGGVQAEPGAYLGLVAQGFNAARTANPEAKVVLAEFDPAGDDLAFLEGIYEAQGQPFFDIVAIRLDGGERSPDDRHVAAGTLNLSRAVLFRDLMEDWGDAAKPIWASHYGWRAGDGGNVTRDEQADFVVAGIERARAEWPWMGLMFAWDFFPRGADDPDVAYALLNPDGTATPLFSALAAFGATDETNLAPTGMTPVNGVPLSYDGNWADQHLSGRTFRVTAEVGASVTIRFEGTGLIAFLRESPQAGLIHATLDGEPVPGWPVEDGAAVIDLEFFETYDIPIRLADGLDDTTHEMTLTLADPGQLTLGGVTVVREVPLVWPVIVLAGVGGLLVFLGVRELIYTIAIRSGHLQRRRGVELIPPLPQMPDFRPARRA